MRVRGVLAVLRANIAVGCVISRALTRRLFGAIAIPQYITCSRTPPHCIIRVIYSSPSTSSERPTHLIARNHATDAFVYTRRRLAPRARPPPAARRRAVPVSLNAPTSQYCVTLQLGPRITGDQDELQAPLTFLIVVFISGFDVTRPYIAYLIDHTLVSRLHILFHQFIFF